MMKFLLGLMPMWAWAIVLAALLAGTAGIAGKAGWDAGAARVEKAWEKERKEREALIEEANMRANQAALRYEEWKLRQQPKVVTIVKEVTRALEINREWSSAPIPDGVRLAIEAIPADIGATKPDGGLP